ncbi:DUF11 domain-containing protein, partial [Candidatus Bipolaricaulota bacterium]|nr:DUF11 domain-containing protein [Candidatus Bipolaricaulota bacterium]
MTGQAARTGGLIKSRKTTLTAALVAAIIILSVSVLVSATGALSIQIDPANQADIFIYDETDGVLIYSGAAVSPLNIDVTEYHIYTVWVEKNGHRLLVNNWPKNNSGAPNDWVIAPTGDEATGEVQGGAEAVHFDSDSVDLSIAKICEPLIAGAQNVKAYTLVITHESGWIDATSVSVIDQLPSGLTNATYTLDGSYQGAWPTSSPYSVSLGLVVPGAVHVIEIYADVDFGLTSIDINTASVSSSDDVYSDNDTDQCMNTITPRGRIIIQKETDPSGNLSTFSFSGGLGSFNLAGDGASQSFILEPGIYEVTEATASGWVLTSISDNDPDAGTTSSGSTATIDLDAGESITVTYHNYLERADLVVIKTDNVDPVAAGEQLTYTVTVTNNGPSNATGVVVTDILPAEVSYFSGTPSQGTFSSGTGVWTVGSLADGASATLTLVVDVDPGISGTIINNVCATGNEPDSVSGNNCDDEETTVVDGYVTITPGEAVNQVGGPHTLIITAYAVGDVPTDWDLTAYDVTPSPSSETLTGPVVAGDGLSATWELEINSASPGLFSTSAAANISFGSTVVGVSTNGEGNNSDPGEKTYIDVRLTLT